MNENWARWEKQVVNGVFPLRRSVRTSDHSAVFLTEHKTKAIPDALLKLVPAIPTLKEAQLAHWSMASRLSHPCLVRLLDTGTCQLEGLQFLFVVTEYAEQTLAQILAERALAPAELRKWVRPILEALSFLHRKKLVHGGLKPSNLLLFKERLKLASDAVRPADESTASIAPPSVFDPPESRDGSFSAAGDVWSLGVLIVEALTQTRPVWPDKSGTAVLPATLPAAFTEIVRRCLSRNPANRPTVEELDAQINPMPPLYLVSNRRTEELARAEELAPTVGFVSPPVVHTPPVVYPQPVIYPDPEARPDSVVLRQPVNRAVLESTAAGAPPDRRPSIAPDKRAPKRNVFLTRAALMVTGVVSAGWCVAVLLSSHGQGAPLVTVKNVTPAVSAAAASAVPVPVMSGAPTALAGSEAPKVFDPDAAVHEELPDVPDKALATIQGRMLFAVRVTVDPEGRIVHAAALRSRSSKYFARLCVEAAMRWKFAPADTIATRKWLVHFEFTRAGVAAHAT